LPLNYEELKAIKDELWSSRTHSEESQKVLKNLFFDVLSTVGTNPATMLIKKEIESRQLTGLTAINALQVAIHMLFCCLTLKMKYFEDKFIQTF